MNDRRYSVILADPPWDYRVWSRDTGAGRSAESHYPTMTTKQIMSLPVGDLAAKDSVLFLWGVWPSIFDKAPQVLDAWGFRYATLAWDWIKLNRSGVGWHVGMGYYTRANPEPCLLAVRGRMPVAVRDERNLLITYEDEIAGLPLVAPVGRHSQKPDAQYGKIERLYPAEKYPFRIELFARRRKDGWEAWGNEVTSDIEIGV